MFQNNFLLKASCFEFTPTTDRNSCYRFAADGAVFHAIKRLPYCHGFFLCTSRLGATDKQRLKFRPKKKAKAGYPMTLQPQSGPLS
eukprot:g67594.t1